MSRLPDIADNAVVFFWKNMPLLITRLSYTFKNIIDDGRYFSGVPVINFILPILAIVIGFYSGVIDRGGMPVYTANPAYLSLLLMFGVMSGYLGLLAFSGFLLGDILFFSFYDYYHPHWSYPLAILGSWIFLWQLVISFPHLSKYMSILPDKWRKFQILLAVPLTMALTELWTILAMIVLRPMFLWNGREVDMRLIRFGETEWGMFGLHAHMLTWIAGGAVLFRFILIPIIRVVAPPLQQHINSNEVDKVPLLSKITFPWPLPKFARAAVFTLLMAGLFTKFLSAIFFWLSIGGLASARNIASSYKPVAKWDGWMKKIPPLIRLILTYVLAFALSWLLIGILREQMDLRTLTTSAVTIVLVIALTLPLWPQGVHAVPNLPDWLKRRLPWTREATPALLFSGIFISASAAFAHHCSFKPGCECLTQDEALAAMTAAAATMAAMQQNKPKVYPTDYTKAELEAINKKLEAAENGGVKRVYPESWVIGGGAGGRAAQKLGAKGLEKLRNYIASKNIKVDPKITKQLKNRGWTKKEIEKTIRNPTKTEKTRDTRWRKDGSGKNDDPATAYYDKDGHYVVRNDKTGDIVQIKNKFKEGWKNNLGDK